MIDWWGPIISSTTPAPRATASPCAIRDRVAGAPGHGRPRRVLARAHLRRRRHRVPTATKRARSTSPAAREFDYHNDPRRPPSRATPRLDDARRRRLRRRRRLPVPHRPQGLHDHLGRREHLSAGGGEPLDHPSRRWSTCAVFGVPNDDFGEEVKAVVQPRDMADAGPGARRGAARLLPASTSPRSSARAGSTSRPSCRATPPASSTSACCATATGRAATARSPEVEPL